MQTLYYGLGIIFMLGGVVAAYVKARQLRVGKQEKELSDYKLYVAERYASKEYLSRRSGKFLIPTPTAGLVAFDFELADQVAEYDRTVAGQLRHFPLRELLPGLGRQCFFDGDIWQQIRR